MNKQTYQIQSKTISRCRCTLEALEPVQGTRDRQVGCICKALSSRVLVARATARPEGCRNVTHVGILGLGAGASATEPMRYLPDGSVLPSLSQRLQVSKALQEDMRYRRPLCLVTTLRIPCSPGLHQELMHIFT
jgi:hypothetical protein